MKVNLEGKELVIRIEADTEATEASASGKTRIVASTRGNMTTSVMIKGKPVVIGLNAYIKN